jgi:uncharacterized FlaG/YvyC family protein
MSEPQSDAIGPIGGLSSTDFNSINDSPAPATPQNAAPAAGTATGSRPTQPAVQDLKTAVVQANANLSNYGRVMDYGVDPATGISIATIRDSQTRAVLQQIPSTDMLHLAKLLADWAPGKNLQLDLLA